MNVDDFMVKIEFDIKAMYEIARNTERKGVRLAIAQGVTFYKESFEESGAVKSAKSPTVKAFISYAIEALTLVAGIAAGKHECFKPYYETIRRIEDIRREYVPRVELNREF